LELVVPDSLFRSADTVLDFCQGGGVVHSEECKGLLIARTFVDFQALSSEFKQFARADRREPHPLCVMAGVGALRLFDAIHLDAFPAEPLDSVDQLLARFGLIRFIPFSKLFFATTATWQKPGTRSGALFFFFLSYLIQSGRRSAQQFGRC